MMYRAAFYDALRSCHFRETGKSILHKVKLSQKLMNIYKHLASGKFIAQKLSQIRFQIRFIN